MSKDPELSFFQQLLAFASLAGLGVTGHKPPFRESRWSNRTDEDANGEHGIDEHSQGASDRNTDQAP